MLDVLKAVVQRNCTEQGHHRGIEHICAGRIVRVKVPAGLFSIVALPYCEFHARWVQGKA